TVTTSAGRTHQGTIVAVATDFWALASGTRLTFVAVKAVSQIRTAPSALPAAAETPASTRTANLDMTLADALAVLAADRPTVTVSTAGGDAVTGELWAVGADVVTIRTPSVPPAPVYIPLSSVLDCSTLASGRESGYR